MSSNCLSNPDIAVEQDVVLDPQQCPVVCQTSVNTSCSKTLSKHGKNIQWWYLGPVVLAFMMFLLVGTIFERKLEALWRHVSQRRQAMVLSSTVATQEPYLSNNSLQTLQPIKTPSLRTVPSTKGTIMTMTCNEKIENEPKSDTKSLCRFCLSLTEDDKKFNEIKFGPKITVPEPFIPSILRNRVDEYGNVHTYSPEIETFKTETSIITYGQQDNTEKHRSNTHPNPNPLNKN